MKIEKERKYLLRGLPDVPYTKIVLIKQYYFDTKKENTSLRLRTVEDILSIDSKGIHPLKHIKNYITFKEVKGELSERNELEERVSKEWAGVLINTMAYKMVYKLRYYWPDLDNNIRTHEIIIDHFIFPECGLLLAEIEEKAPNSNFAIPIGLENVIESDVTNDIRYLNCNIARVPSCVKVG
ncbi:MAG: hypothetical protein WC783_04430 [Candidatus Paceibacterota bacterium]|jgi:CYTH domain-containing protein